MKRWTPQDIIASIIVVAMLLMIAFGDKGQREECGLFLFAFLAGYGFARALVR